MTAKPPLCLAKCATLVSPNPVPTPGPFVVKNGSIAWFRTSAGMPTPLSAIERQT